MADKKYQVFISSTYTDLIEERRKILDILLMADCIPAGMEAFAAADEEQFNIIKKVIDLCDYYILIIGKRYGSINESTGISYTEMEYEYAKAQNIPILVFAINDSVKLPEDKKETSPERIAALKKFREKALSNRLAAIWSTSDELTGKVAISIAKATKELHRPGWQRATDYDEASLRREIMSLQKENEQLTANLNNAKAEIISLSTIDHLAFEECEFNIGYYKKTSDFSKHTYHTKEVKLPQLFMPIAIQMLGCSISERSINNCLIEYLFGGTSASIYYSFSDSLIIKRILLQLEALGLIQSHWSTEAKALFWQLTTKGVLTRNRLILKTNKLEQV